MSDSKVIRRAPNVVSITNVQMTAANVCTTRDQPCERHAVGAAETEANALGRQMREGISQRIDVHVPVQIDRRSAIAVQWLCNRRKGWKCAAD